MQQIVIACLLSLWIPAAHAGTIRGFLLASEDLISTTSYDFAVPDSSLIFISVIEEVKSGKGTELRLEDGSSFSLEFLTRTLRHPGFKADLIAVKAADRDFQKAIHFAYAVDDPIRGERLKGLPVVKYADLAKARTDECGLALLHYGSD